MTALAPHAERFRPALPAMPRRSPRPAGAKSVLLGLFVVLLVLPVPDVPGWGISLSTLVFCFLGLQLAAASRRISLRPYVLWILLAALIWMGRFLSIAGNVLANNLADLSSSDVLALLRFAFWMTVFVGTAFVASQNHMGAWLCSFLGVLLAALGLLRLAEAFALGTWGPAEAILRTPNDYGLLFSTFTPFLVWLALTKRGWRQLACSLCSCMVLIAVAANGSRSSWVAVALGLLLTVGLFACTNRHALRRTAAAIAGLAAAALLSATIIPDRLWTPVKERFATLDHLEQDKPYAVRLLMLQKAANLFADNPVFGIGAGRFRSTNAALVVPALLDHKSRARLDTKSAHNSYAAALAETGAVGAAPLLLFLLILLFRGAASVWRGVRRGEDWIVPVYVSFVCMSVHLWTLAGLTGSLPWFVYGLLAAVIHQSRRREFGVWRRGSVAQA